jgi:N-acetylglucosaminyldiphosphoundecaprenol N-acetyl-beta-D-mannosaminyltransferase
MVTGLKTEKTDKMKKYKQNTEAERGKKDRINRIILGVEVSSTSKTEVLRKIEEKCNENVYNKPLFIVTAYSEFFIEAETDKEFAAALNKADLVLPDGVSVPAALDYLRLAEGKQLMGKLITGLQVGGRVLRGKYAGKVVTGVGLTRELLETGNKNKWRVFLLGGFGNVAERLTDKLKQNYPGLCLGWDRAGENNEEIRQRSREIVIKTEKFKPDLLLVAMGRYKQEKWIAEHLSGLGAKVVMGVGSSFDELLGEGKWAAKPPGWVEQSGLKWLWRVGRDPKHLKRAWRAFPLFTWKVFRRSLIG